MEFDKLIEMLIIMKLFGQLGVQKREYTVTEMLAQYSYVRISDILPNQTGYPWGEADIDAVGAISSAPPVVPVPEPATMLLFGIGLVGLIGTILKRRKNNG